jgi:hypothetical protein
VKIEKPKANKDGVDTIMAFCCCRRHDNFVGNKLCWKMSTKDIAPVIVGFLVQWVAFV